MRRTEIIAYCSLLALATFSCIKPYEPAIEKTDQSLFVVSGMVTDQEGYQYVNISLSAEVNEPRYLPLAGCQAEIQESQGSIYPMEDVGDGNYRVWMEAADLVPGKSYRIRLVTPTGLELMSDFDRLPEGPPIDSIYYELDEVLTNDPDHPTLGIRMYADLDARGYESRYFRWEVAETWEYHMDYVREWYYDGAIHKVDPPDNSAQVCWYTGKVNEIFTVSTGSLEENIYRKFPLHFVDNRTTKLTYLYSMMIRQYALSEDAYHYWDKLRVNSQNQGGLYEQQPLPVEGNVYHTADPDVRVLGFFSAASVRSKRVFISPVEGLELDPRPLCIGPVPLGIFGWSDFQPDEFPVYFIRIDNAIFTLDDNCIDCRLQGGVNVKPEFWPELP